MRNRSVLIDLDDPRMSALADVLANKSSKKILSLLAGDELSTSEIALRLKMPITTVDYNMKKLTRAGLIEKTRSLMSSKGKIVPVYRVSESRIVISPKSILRGIVPAFFVTAAVAICLRIWEASYRAKILLTESASPAQFGVASVETVKSVSFAAINNTSTNVVLQSFSDKLYYFLANAYNSWAFLIGAFFALCVVLLWNRVKKNKFGNLK